MVYDTLGMSRNGFILAFTLVAVAAFWLSEWAERARTGVGGHIWVRHS